MQSLGKTFHNVIPHIRRYVDIYITFVVALVVAFMGVFGVKESVVFFRHPSSACSSVS